MTNNELLLAMSDMLDTKLKAELQPLRNEMQDMKSELRSEMLDMKNELQNEIQGVSGELQNEIQAVRSELQNEIQSVRSELQNAIQGVRSELRDVEQNLKKEIHMLKLCQENLILPRLNTIESCYNDTYHRYRDNADQMEAVSADVDIMKKVITEHSQQLQKLA